MDLIAQGVDNCIISFDEDQKYITYHLKDAKKRCFTSPEETIQVDMEYKLKLYVFLQNLQSND